jgi:glycosyltransferase involved in cell wall biosynthesis
MNILITNLESLGTPSGPAVFIKKLLARLPQLQAITYRNMYGASLQEREVNVRAATVFNEIYWIPLSGWRALLGKVLEADLVHFNPFNVSECLIAMLMRVMGKKIVATFQSHIELPLSSPKMFLEGLRLFLVFNTLILLVDRMVFLTKAHGENYRRHTLFRKTFHAKTRIISHAIEPERFLQRRVAQAKPPSLLFVGRIEPKKGAFDLVRLIEEWDDPDVTFTLVGGGDVGLAAQRLQHRKNAFVLGAVDNERLYELYDRANILIVPTHSESFGIVTIEAMARGLVILISDVPGMREIVRDGRNGYFFPPGDTAAMRERILHLKVHPEEVDRISRNNLQDVQRFSTHIQATRYWTLYHEILAADH